MSTSTFSIKPARTALYCDGCGRPAAVGDVVVITGEWSEPTPRLVVCENCVDGLIDALTDEAPMPKQEVQP